MSVRGYSEILKSARQLSLEDQAELAEALLHNLRLALRDEPREPADQRLVPLTNMSKGELRVLAEAILAPSRQQELQTLLEKNRSGNLSAEEEERLNAVLAEADRVALLKARALYTLQEHPSVTEADE